ncbi:MAG: type II toxin-antitoxin system RelE/ParE family toxin [Methanobrevibacter sp.]|nr:type II toxin-antitoxin system RelE/ParE family toxin [Candidatus Methanoflexus mossambicus]
MTYETVFTKKAIKFLRIKLKKDKKTGERLLKSIKELQKDPYMNKKMEGIFKGTRRQKIGDYRILYEIL